MTQTWCAPVALAAALALVLVAAGYASRCAPSSHALGLRLAGPAAAPPPLPLPPRFRITPTIHQVFIQGDWTRPANWTAPRDLDAPFLAPNIKGMMQSWVEMNPGWEYKIWDRRDVVRLLTKHYPQHLDAWKALPHDVERADFSRYAILHHEGGVYSDADVVCNRPLSAVLQPGDSAVGIWEGFAANTGTAAQWGFGRVAQICNWWIAAAPGHPVLSHIMDSITNLTGIKLFEDPIRDVIVRTGPGMFTGGMLWGAFEHPPSKGDGWPVRVLPQVCGGAVNDGINIIEAPIIQHKFAGSWKGPFPATLQGPAQFAPDHVERDPCELLPTSTPYFQPPYTILHHRLAEGDWFAGIDMSQQLGRYGGWQPNNIMGFPPSLLEAFLQGLVPGPGREHVILDVGAGYGTTSLAAGARGLRVLAFELASKAADALQASIQYNGFGDRLTLVSNVVLWSVREKICVDTQPAADAGLSAVEQEGIRRGYGPQQYQRRLQGCRQEALRRPAVHIMHEMLPEGHKVQAVRVSANMGGPHVLRALLPLLRDHPVRKVMLEWLPDRRNGDHWASEASQELIAVLDELLGLGFVEARHGGDICSNRWDSKAGTVTSVIAEGGMSLNPDASELRNGLLPCHLVRERLEELRADLLGEGRVEVFLLQRPEAALASLKS